MSNALKILSVLVLVLVNAFFVMAELVLVRIRVTQLEPLAARGNRRARIAREIVSKIDSYLGATQFGITLVSLAMGVVVEPVFRDLLAPVFAALHITSSNVERIASIVVGFFVNSYLLIVAGELAPKALAIRRTLPTALAVAAPLRWFYRISYPFVWILNHSAQWLLRRLGMDGTGEVKGGHSEEELRLLLTSSQRISGVTAFGRNIVLNALDLRQRLVRDVMRPRQEIAALDTEATIAECLEVAEKTRYSRLPLCEHGDLDKTLGVVHTKDLYAVRIRAHSGADLKAVMRKLIYVPETARLERLLQTFLERKLHLAIVVDEYGGTVGLVTLENILEELVGQIQDEFDQEKPLLIRTSETSWEASGLLPLHELEELVGAPLQEEGITTASGWITQRLGGFPKAGDTLTAGACEFRVEAMDGMRVDRLRISKRADAETSI